jgi:photosystem I P700 chlorophyll a apoprotein A2
MQLAHSLLDPNFGSYGSDVYSSGLSEVTSVPSYSGIYQWLYTVGIKSESDIYILSFTLEILALLLQFWDFYTVN